MTPRDAIRQLAEASGGTLTVAEAGDAIIAVGYLTNRDVIAIEGGRDWLTVVVSRYGADMSRHEVGRVTVALGTTAVVA